MPLHRLPLDDWFDDVKKHPYDSWPIATDVPEVGEWLPENGEEPPKEDTNIHQKMYSIATSKYNPFSVGGSENASSI
jgi:hypothetical protein